MIDIEHAPEPLAALEAERDALRLALAAAQEAQNAARDQAQAAEAQLVALDGRIAEAVAAEAKRREDEARDHLRRDAEARARLKAELLDARRQHYAEIERLLSELAAQFTGAVDVGKRLDTILLLDGLPANEHNETAGKMSYFIKQALGDCGVHGVPIAALYMRRDHIDG